MASEYAYPHPKVNNMDILIPESFRDAMYIPPEPTCVYKMNSFLGLQHFLR